MTSQNNYTEQMRAYMKQFKKNIEMLVEQGLLKEAKQLVEEYEKIVPDDVDIYSIRGVIAMIEGDLDEAEELLDIGYNKDCNNLDIIYNKAHLYMKKGEQKLADYFFKRLYNETKNIDVKNEIQQKNYIKDSKVSVLIGSPVYQKPQILKEFLCSLKELNKEQIQVDYYFIDDNKEKESSFLLEQFAKEQEKVFIIKTKNYDEYRCDNITHHWKEDLIWKVADFKNLILKYAKKNEYDYVFLIDSDIVLHPNTLKHLVSTGKDIISEIFWTKWQPDMIELPQVWLMDTYTQYFYKREEIIGEEEKISRQICFLNMLKKRGIYEVGGLGACTLISKFALTKGVNFNEIENLSFWGEDRHFCVRAKALGLKLYVDTHYPAFHMYRESDFKLLKKRITLSMIVKNEADRYLRRVLTSVKRYIDSAVIIDDGSTDNTVDLIKEILDSTPLVIIQNKKSKFINEVELRKQQWEETIKTNPEWILNLDADEMLEDRAEFILPKLVEKEDVDVYCFRLYDFWDETHYREDEYWKAHLFYRPFLVRYKKDFYYKWKETPQHRGRFPINITELSVAISDLRVKHFGWANQLDREEKYKRYMLLDPEGKFGIKEQYESILDINPCLKKWEE